MTSSNTLLRSQRWLTFLYIIKRGWDRRIICSSNLSLLLKTDQLLESVVHLLDGLVFGQAHAALVRDIVDTALGFGVLTAGAADLRNDQKILSLLCKAHNFLENYYLEVVLSGGFLELSAVGSQFGQLDVDGSADGGAQVGRAEGQEAEAVVVREGDPLLNVVDSVDQTGIDGLQVTTLLHGDDAQVILFVAPDQESLVHVVVDTTASWPVSASVGSLTKTLHFIFQNAKKFK